jgi:hypothetical protein
MKDNRNQATDGEAKAKPEVIKLGLDLHALQVTECRQTGRRTCGDEMFRRVFKSFRSDQTKRLCPTWKLLWCPRIFDACQ